MQRTAAGLPRRSPRRSGSVRSMRTKSMGSPPPGCVPSPLSSMRRTTARLGIRRASPSSRQTTTSLARHRTEERHHRGGEPLGQVDDHGARRPAAVHRAATPRRGLEQVFLVVELRYQVPAPLGAAGPRQRLAPLAPGQTHRARPRRVAAAPEAATGRSSCCMTGNRAKSRIPVRADRRPRAGPCGTVGDPPGQLADPSSSATVHGAEDTAATPIPRPQTDPSEPEARSPVPPHVVEGRTWSPGEGFVPLGQAEERSSSSPPGRPYRNPLESCP